MSYDYLNQVLEGIKLITKATNVSPGCVIYTLVPDVLSEEESGELEYKLDLENENT